jgi:predicted DNA-binding transcriptional regulator YafY
MRPDTCQQDVRFDPALFRAQISACEGPLNSIERALAILLLLTRGRMLTAAYLAERFEVSVRTIYRDIDRLIALGIPVEALRGAEGGFRLSEGFLSPPIALNSVETTALLVALTLVRGLETTPLTADLEAAEAKLLAALPKAAREILARGPRIVGVERAAADVFHGGWPTDESVDQCAAVDLFLQGILKQRRVELTHRNVYRGSVRVHEAEPQGLLWDRDRWYLVGWSLTADELRMWRADRVLSIIVTGMAFRPRKDFDVRTLLGRQWLEQAMRSWDGHRERTQIAMSAEAATKLRRDWFYRRATYAENEDGRTVMTIPETNPDVVLPLVRWLGAEAELLAPESLRDRLRGELDAIRRTYE